MHQERTIPMDLKGRVVVITGAASGMGRASARMFAAEQATVVGADRDEDGLDALGRELAAAGHPVSAHYVDIADESSVKALVDATVEEHGRIDVLFNNAAIGPSSSARHAMANVVDTPADAWDAIMAINLKGPGLMCKHVIPVMRENGGGSVIMNSSINGMVGVQGADAYTATKGGLVALTKAMAVEWAPYGIRVNCICPGPTDTPMNAPWLGDAAKREYLVAGCPMGRVARPEEIAGVAVFLASDLSSFVNGAIIPVDGGWTAA